MALSQFGDFIDSHHTYSLEGDDRIASSLLRKLLHTHDKSVPFYLDIGANEPIYGNNTYLFYTLGFFGICVDPIPEVATKFNKARPRDHFHNVAIVEHERVAELTIYENDGASTIDPLTKSRYDAKFDTHSVISVEGKTLSSVLSDHRSGTRFPLLTIDVEGSDLIVLNQAIKSNHCFELIIVEDKHFSLHAPFPQTEVSTLLASCGFTFVARTPLNSFYINSESDAFDWLPSVMTQNQLK